MSMFDGRIKSFLDLVTKTDTIWYDSDNEPHRISEMDDMYIFHCVAKLRRENYVIPDLMLERMEEFKKIRPEMFL